MPKETIKTSSDWKLAVSWARDDYVQVGASTGTEDGQFFTLNRAELNKMISTLRKARDQAYGKDA